MALSKVLAQQEKNERVRDLPAKVSQRFKNAHFLPEDGDT